MFGREPFPELKIPARIAIANHTVMIAMLVNIFIIFTLISANFFHLIIPPDKKINLINDVHYLIITYYFIIQEICFFCQIFMFRK